MSKPLEAMRTQILDAAFLIWQPKDAVEYVRLLEMGALEPLR
jgi:hypothetical protein